MTFFRLSVLVTFYNQQEYVDDALGSILNQKTDFGFKILVGDDGSSDDTQIRIRKWIEKYPDRIELFVMDRTPEAHIPGFRASKNRLNLLKHVDTEYFTFLDGDDFYIFDKKLQKQIDVLDDKKNADCIACGHNIDMLFQDGHRSPMAAEYFEEGIYDSRTYWNEMYSSTDTLVIRKSVICRINTKLLENNFNDNLITFSIIQYGKLYYIPESWVIYRQTGSGIWTSDNAIVNSIRNMIAYDICNKINPYMYRETAHRFAHAWATLFLLRNKLDSDALMQYNIETKDKGLVESNKWINYNSLKNKNKVRLCIKAIQKSWKQIIQIILLNLYRKLFKASNS